MPFLIKKQIVLVFHNICPLKSQAAQIVPAFIFVYEHKPQAGCLS